MPYRDHRGDCPRCRSFLVAAASPGDAPRLDCGACGGFFLSNEALRREYADLLPQVHGAMSAIPAEPLACPRCGQSMRRVAIDAEDGTVRVDFCNAHGAWFDGEDLERLTAPAR